VEAERVMAKIQSTAGYSTRYVQHHKMMNLARKIARSGEHANHHDVLSRLMIMEDPGLVQEWLKNYAFCLQLDRLCAVAQGTAHDLTSRPFKRANAPRSGAPAWGSP
jgi:hypothetical protein